jgi:hypothetical protein
VRLLNEACVPVTLNSFYGGNSQWFKNDKTFMDWMWKDVRGGNGDWTVLTPDGRYLDKGVWTGFTKWKQMPRSQRKPGAYPIKKLTSVPKGAPPERPPAGTLVVRTFQRNLRQGARGRYYQLTKEHTKHWPRDIQWYPQYNDSFADVMWLSEGEWKSLIPAHPRKGDQFPLPNAVKKRLLLWHLTNRTFCVGMPWLEKDIQSENLSLQVTKVSPVLRLRLQGSVLLEMKGTPEDLKIAWGRTKHGYDARVLGFLDYDPAKKAFTRFDGVAIGDYWGGDCEGGRHSKVGRLPLGISFELATGDSLVDSNLPCGGVFFDKYLRQPANAAQKKVRVEAAKKKKRARKKKVASQSHGTTKGLLPKRYELVRDLVKPRQSEHPWNKVKWVKTLWQAHEKAVKEGKPIVVFAVGGEPLGIL